jgi:hypothetical protein
MDLYALHTIAEEYHGCKNVTFDWFRCEKTKRPYADLIENYDPKDEHALYKEMAIEELFTAAEANLLKEYLDRDHRDAATTIIEKLDLPLANNVVGIGAIVVGGGDDFYLLHREPEYSLPFKVEGYFNLVGCELVDEPDETFRHYLLLMEPDGVREETQQEARRREAASSAACGGRIADQSDLVDIPHSPPPMAMRLRLSALCRALLPGLIAKDHHAP